MRTYSAWVPSMALPRLQPPLRQWEYICFLQKADVFPLPQRRLDSRQHHRWDPGRIRAHPVCRHQSLPAPAGHRGRSSGDAQRYPAHRLRVRCSEGQVKLGDTIAIVGAGPVGLAALMTAQFYSPAAIFSIDLDDSRLKVAKSFGATTLINSADGTAAQRVMELTHGEGVDVAIEAVGIPATFDICQGIIGAGGHLAN